jgi:hypothetical protein
MLNKYEDNNELFYWRYLVMVTFDSGYICDHCRSCSRQNVSAEILQFVCQLQCDGKNIPSKAVPCHVLFCMGICKSEDMFLAAYNFICGCFNVKCFSSVRNTAFQSVQRIFSFTLSLRSCREFQPHIINTIFSAIPMSVGIGFDRCKQLLFVDLSFLKFDV